jgi:hypothetical protein
MQQINRLKAQHNREKMKQETSLFLLHLSTAGCILMLYVVLLWIL